MPSGQLGWRTHHSTVVIGNRLFLLGGNQQGLLSEDDDPAKLKFPAFVDVLDLPTCKWMKESTTGELPEGLRFSCCANINKNVLYFGGNCKAADCFHNDMFELNIDTQNWRKLLSINPGSEPMEKCGCGMILCNMNGKDQLLVLGGYGQTPVEINESLYVPHPFYPNLCITNESHIWCPQSSAGEWKRLVSHLPPCSFFSVDKLPGNRGVMFGGIIPDGSGIYCSNNVILFQCSQDSLKVEKEIKIFDTTMKWPKRRSVHASTIINTVSPNNSHHLVIMGGLDDDLQTVSDCWILNLSTFVWYQLNLPESVTRRYYHSLSTYYISNQCVWIVVTGGNEEYNLDEDECDIVHRPISGSNVTMIIELVCDGDCVWAVQHVWNSHQLFLRNQHQSIPKCNVTTNQGKEEIYLEKEKKLFRKEKDILKLQFTVKDKDETIDKLVSLLKEKELQIEDFSKILAPENFASMKRKPLYSTQILKEEPLKKLVKQEHKESGGKDEETDFLMDDGNNIVLSSTTDVVKGLVVKQETDETNLEFKEIEEMQELVEDRNLILSSDALESNQRDVGIQFDYMVTVTDQLFGVRVAAEKLFYIRGDKYHSLNWDECGFRMNIPQGSLPASQVCEIAIKALIAGPFEFPDEVELVSAIYSISIAKPLLKPVELELQHCVSLTEKDQAEYLSFMISNKTDPNLCHKFDFLEGGEFYPHKRYGKIKQVHFCKTGIGKKKSLSPNSESATEQTTENFNDKCNRSQGSTSNSTSLLVKRPDESLEDPPAAKREKKNEANDDSEYTNYVENTSSESQSQQKRELVSTNDIPFPDNIYTGKVVYERRQLNVWFMKFMIAQDVAVFIKYIAATYPNAVEDEIIRFSFLDPVNGYIELDTANMENVACRGWHIEPHKEPLKLRKRDADLFGSAGLPIPPSCLVTVWADVSCDPERRLRHPVALSGIDTEDAKIIYISQFLETSNTLEFVSQHASQSQSGESSFHRTASFHTESSLSHCSDKDSMSHVCHCVLGSKDHSKVFNSCKIFSKDWKYIGSALGIEVDILQTIKKDCDDVKDMMFEMIASWLKRESEDQPKPSWNILLTTLNEFDRGETEKISSQFKCPHVP